MARGSPTAKARGPRRSARPPRSGTRRGRVAATPALLFAACLGAGLLVYRPALGGPIISHDSVYLAQNPQVQSFTLESALEILAPAGDVTLRVANYAPVHLLGHMLEWRLFGQAFHAYHLTNLVLHVLVVVLLIGLFEASGVPPLWARLAGGLFLVHPANVEAVAWISQLKTLLAMLFMLAALRLRLGRPILATLAFALALLSKAPAAVAVPVAVLMEWSAAGAPAPGASPAPRSRRWVTLGAWTAVLLTFALVQFWAFRHANLGAPPLSDDPAVRVWTSLAIAGRYLVMAATAIGVSAFHEPDPVHSPFDPWVLGAVAALLLLGGRAVWALLRRREEAAWWAWAAISFLPVSQLFPFLYPIADRYLYFVLPGLLGGCLLAAGDLLRPLATQRLGRLVGRASAVALGALGVVFAAQSFERASLWTSERRLVVDGVRHYPNGSAAHYFKAREDALAGDVPAAVAHLRKATARGHRGLEVIYGDASFARHLSHPALREFTRELARRQIAEIESSERLTVPNRIWLARAYLAADEPGRAIEILEEALAQGSDFEPAIRDLLAQARAAARSARRPGAGPDG